MEWNGVHAGRVYQFRKYNLVVWNRLFADLCATFQIHEIEHRQIEAADGKYQPRRLRVRARILFDTNISSLYSSRPLIIFSAATRLLESQLHGDLVFVGTFIANIVGSFTDGFDVTILSAVGLFLLLLFFASLHFNLYVKLFRSDYYYINFLRVLFSFSLVQLVSVSCRHRRRRRGLNGIHVNHTYTFCCRISWL